MAFKIRKWPRGDKKRRYKKLRKGFAGIPPKMMKQFTFYTDKPKKAKV